LNRPAASQPNNPVSWKSEEPRDDRAACASVELSSLAAFDELFSPMKPPGTDRFMPAWRARKDRILWAFLPLSLERFKYHLERFQTEDLESF
jgi:hypothetical protein